LPTAQLTCRATAGVARDEVTLQPRVYLNTLPAAFAPGTRVLVTDPLIATGAQHSAVCCLCSG
jgi:uracil phosphoribosyltransferase